MLVGFGLHKTPNLVASLVMILTCLAMISTPWQSDCNWLCDVVHDRKSLRTFRNAAISFLTRGARFRTFKLRAVCNSLSRTCTNSTNATGSMCLPDFNTLGFYKDDTTVYLPPYSRTDPTTLIYFITGNPGVIGYYATFLQSLYELLREPKQGIPKPYQPSTSANHNFSVLGTSLAGFETVSLHRSHPHDGSHSLQSQIELSEARLGNFLHRHASSLPEFSEPAKVILVGHSVGAYILLELLRRQQERAQKDDRGVPKGEIVGGISLFPTVTWIAKSPSGRRLGWALKLPGFARITGALARGIGFLIPEFVLWRIVGVLAGMPPKAARTTTAFLRSPVGVKQALWMAGDEMRVIEEDRWDDALWACDKTKLVFYFGESDHWVNNTLRDELMRLRSFEGKEWPKMVLDQQHIPHDFCISRSDATAKITAEWVKKIMEDESLRED